MFSAIFNLNVQNSEQNFFLLRIRDEAFVIKRT